MKLFTPDEFEFHVTQVNFPEQKLGIYRQRDWTSPLDKMKFRQLVDDAVEKFGVAKALKFEDLARQAQLQARYSQLESQYKKYFYKLYIKSAEFALQFDWRDLINKNHLKYSLIGIFG